MENEELKCQHCGEDFQEDSTECQHCGKPVGKKATEIEALKKRVVEFIDDGKYTDAIVELNKARSGCNDCYYQQWATRKKRFFCSLRGGSDCSKSGNCYVFKPRQ